jgi:tetratricopeptide (TPR) repeat protein
LQLSNLAFNEGNTTLAKHKAEEAIELAQSSDIRILATNGLIDLGYALMSRGEFDEAGKALTNALKSAETDQSPLGKARALLGQGNLYLQLANPDDAINALSQAVEFYQPSGYRRQTSTCLLLLSRANRLKGRYDEALATSEDVLRLAKELNDNSLVAAAHSNIGYTLGIYQERYVEGLAHMEESRRLNDMLGDKLGVGFDLMNQGRMLWQLGRYAEARKALDDANKIADHPDASYKAVLSYICLANAQMLLSEARFSESIKQSQRALELTGNRDSKQDKEVTIQAKCALGLATALSGSSRTGREMCEQAVAAARYSPRLLSSSLLSLAEAQLAANDPKGALASALEAKESFESYGQQDSLWRAWLIAARASKLAGDGSSVEYATRAMDSLSSFERALGPEASEKYSARPDVKASQGLIEQLRATK